MRWLLIVFSLTFLVACSDEPKNKISEPSITPLRLQLNWFHDPTFSGEYKAKQIMGEKLEIIEGGVNVSPIQRLKSGLADVSVVGIDIALKAIESDIASDKSSTLRIIYVDFQRNPVGWIIHPNTADKFGMKESIKQNGLMRNDWLFDQFRKGNIRPGDKRGTETTAVWTRWRKLRRLSGVNVTAVGFDPAIMLDAPDLAYPVYMNEEPFKLGERIGQDVIVFDPADDSVELYGNVLVTRAELLESRRKDINDFLNILTNSWRFVKDSNDEMVTIVRAYYPDVSEPVLKSQISRTTDFVFYKTDHAGGIDLSQGGRLDQTVEALKSAVSIGERMDLSLTKQYCIPFIRSSK